MTSLDRRPCSLAKPSEASKFSAVLIGLERIFNSVLETAPPDRPNRHKLGDYCDGPTTSGPSADRPAGRPHRRHCVRLCRCIDQLDQEGSEKTAPPDSCVTTSTLPIITRSWTIIVAERSRDENRLDQRPHHSSHLDR